MTSRHDAFELAVPVGPADHVVGPVTTFQLFPALSLKPVILTVCPFQGVLVETNATSVEAPTELNAGEV